MEVFLVEKQGCNLATQIFGPKPVKKSFQIITGQNQWGQNEDVDS